MVIACDVQVAPGHQLPQCVCLCERVDVKLLSRGSNKCGLLLFREWVRVREQTGEVPQLLCSYLNLIKVRQGIIITKALLYIQTHLRESFWVNARHRS